MQLKMLNQTECTATPWCFPTDTSCAAIWPCLYSCKHFQWYEGKFQGNWPKGYSIFFKSKLTKEEETHFKDKAIIAYEVTWKMQLKGSHPFLWNTQSVTSVWPTQVRLAGIKSRIPRSMVPALQSSTLIFLRRKAGCFWPGFVMVYMFRGIRFLDFLCRLGELLGLSMYNHSISGSYKPCTSVWPDSLQRKSKLLNQPKHFLQAWSDVGLYLSWVTRLPLLHGGLIACAQELPLETWS